MDKETNDPLARETLSFLGLARKAGLAECGEDAVDAAVHLRKARLILLASDASDNTARRAERQAEQCGCPCLRLPLEKTDLGKAMGRGICAVAALTDIGFAAAAANKMAPLDPAFAEAAELLSAKAERYARRKEKKKRRASSEKTTAEKNRKFPEKTTAENKKGFSEKRPTEQKTKKPGSFMGKQPSANPRGSSLDSRKKQHENNRTRKRAVQH